MIIKLGINRIIVSNISKINKIFGYIIPDKSDPSSNHLFSRKHISVSPVPCSAITETKLRNLLLNHSSI